MTTKYPNDILPFGDQASEARYDILPLEEYKADPQRRIGHQPGIARQDLANRQARQAAHMAAGLARFIANRFAGGVQDDGDLEALETGILEAVRNVIRWPDQEIVWSPAEDYRKPLLVFGLNGKVYLRKKASGPSIADVGPKEPGAPGSEEHWLDYAASIMPDTLTDWRNIMAGTPVWWPSNTIPILADGVPYGLPLDGAVVSLATYPRLACIACPAATNAWAPAWYRCDVGGKRNAGGECLKLDDWRDGYPQIVGDPASSQHGSTVLITTTNGSPNITVTNNLSDGGTLLTPKASTGNIYPGLRITGAGIPAGTTVVSVTEATVTLSAAATATAAGVEVTIWGRVLGSWQGDAMRKVLGRIGRVNGINEFASGALSLESSGAGSPGVGWVMMYASFNSANAVPSAPTTRPAGPAATAIIIV